MSVATVTGLSPKPPSISSRTELDLCSPSAGHRLQLRLQAVVQVPETERRAPQVRQQHVPDVARPDGGGQLLRPDTGPVRPETVPGSVAQLPGCVSAERHVLLPGGAEDRRAQVQARANRGPAAKRPQDPHQGPGDQLRPEPADAQVTRMGVGTRVYKYKLLNVTVTAFVFDEFRSFG